MRKMLHVMVLKRQFTSSNMRRYIVELCMLDATVLKIPEKKNQ